MLTEQYTKRIKRLGAPLRGAAPSQDSLNCLEAHFPNAFVRFIKEYGYTSYFDRGYQFCDPLKFRPLAALIFKADPDLSHSNCHLASMSVWGMLHFWSDEHWRVDVDLLEYTVTCRKLAPSESGGPPIALPPGKRREPDADHISVGLLPFDDNAREMWDWQDKPMFSECTHRHGPLNHGDCFGFVPSLGLVGYNSRERKVENVQKFDALTHFSLIAQMQNFHLVRTVKGRREVIREIG
jgi:hypothetical protein